MMAITTSISINEAPFELSRRRVFQGKLITAARRLTLTYLVINHRLGGLSRARAAHRFSLEPVRLGFVFQ